MRFTLYADYSLLQKKGEESLECKLQKLLENQVRERQKNIFHKNSNRIF